MTGLFLLAFYLLNIEDTILEERHVITQETLIIRIEGDIHHVIDVHLVTGWSESSFLEDEVSFFRLLDEAIVPHIEEIIGAIVIEIWVLL